MRATIEARVIGIAHREWTSKDGQRSGHAYKFSLLNNDEVIEDEMYLKSEDFEKMGIKEGMSVKASIDIRMRVVKPQNGGVEFKVPDWKLRDIKAVNSEFYDRISALDQRMQENNAAIAMVKECNEAVQSSQEVKVDENGDQLPF